MGRSRLGWAMVWTSPARRTPCWWPGSTCALEDTAPGDAPRCATGDRRGERGHRWHRDGLHGTARGRLDRLCHSVMIRRCGS